MSHLIVVSVVNVLLTVFDGVVLDARPTLLTASTLAVPITPFYILLPLVVPLSTPTRPRHTPDTSLP